MKVDFVQFSFSCWCLLYIPKCGLSGQSTMYTWKTLDRFCYGLCCWVECTINFKFVKLVASSYLLNPYRFLFSYADFWRSDMSLRILLVLFSFQFNNICFLSFKVMLVGDTYLWVCFLDELTKIICCIPVLLAMFLILQYMYFFGIRVMTAFFDLYCIVYFFLNLLHVTYVYSYI